MNDMREGTNDLLVGGYYYIFYHHHLKVHNSNHSDPVSAFNWN